MANGFSLLDIMPHQVSKDLRGYSVMFYGPPKTGKTTTASRFPGALILAFEKGYGAIPGIYAQPINSWNEFKKALSQLKDPAVQEKFQTIVIDTADIAYSYCEKYVCARESNEKNNYETLGDIPYGKGYALAQTEFDECLRKIIQLDYGLVIISHDQDKTLKDETGNEYNYITPTLDRRARLVCERTCDIIGYARSVDTEEGASVKLFLRGTPRFMAGSRFRYTPEYIDFNYDSLVNAIADAVTAEEKNAGAQYVTTENNRAERFQDEPTYDFPAMMEEFQSIVGEIMQKNPSMASKITAIVDTHLGKGKKVGDCTEAQAPQLDLILYDLKNL